VNAYEVKAGMVFHAGSKLCDPCLSALRWFVYHARRYTSALFYLFYTVHDCSLSFFPRYVQSFWTTWVRIGAMVQFLLEHPVYIIRECG